MADDSPIQALRAAIRSLETPTQGQRAAISLGIPEMDAALPWNGLPLARLHQFNGGEDGFPGPLLAFTARLSGLLCTRTGGPALWVVAANSTDDQLHGPGLAQAGLPPERLVMVRVNDEADILWSMEEALRCSAVAVVIGQVRRIDQTAGRRLQLAAEQGGVTALLLPSTRGAGWRDTASLAATTATTRWRIDSAPSAPLPWATARWTVTLERCPGGTLRSWLVELNDETGDLALVSALSDRPLEPSARRRA